jgi:hypothetical protein
VRYRVEWGPLGTLAQELFVRRLVNEIFDYRAQAVSEILKPGSQKPASGSK